jgi:hypothetical protein
VEAPVFIVVRYVAATGRLGQPMNQSVNQDRFREKASRSRWFLGDSLRTTEKRRTPKEPISEGEYARRVYAWSLYAWRVYAWRAYAWMVYACRPRKSMGCEPSGHELLRMTGAVLHLLETINV